MKQEKYDIIGMNTAACALRVEKMVSELPGVQNVNVNLLTNICELTYDEQVLDREDILLTVRKAGYDGELHNNGKRGEDQAAIKRTRQIRNRLIISVLLMLPLLYLTLYRYLDAWFHIAPPSWIARTFSGYSNAITYTLTQFLLVLPIMYVNREYYARGFRMILKGHPNMDSLIAIGSSVAAGYGVFAIYRIGYGLGIGDSGLVGIYSRSLYFESAGLILTFITLGKYLEERSKGKTRQAITKLIDLSPKTAVVDRFGQEITIATEDVKVGDIFILRAGSVIPVDGMIIEGIAGVDESAITGESIPVDKKPGDRVVSASVCRSGYLRCKATDVGENTTLAKIIRLVEQASASKAPSSKLSDRMAGIFVPIVILLSVITFAAWYLTGHSSELSISCAIAVLVISCPCAWGLAGPVSIMAGTGVGARLGILFKSGEALQKIQKLDTVVLDKTGTITEGRLSVTDIISYSEEITEDAILAISATLESESEHPIARAIVEEVERRNIPYELLTGFKVEFGKGVLGNVGDFGVFYLGNPLQMGLHRITVTEEQNQRMEELAGEGKTPLFLANESQVIGLLGVSDVVKDSSATAIATLKKMGVHCIMLTGDNERTALAVSRKIGGIDVVAQLLPEDKEKKITEFRKQGHIVGMVGDGVNDAPALAAADIGIAIGAGTEVALESADVILMHSTLEDVATAMKLSGKVFRNIRENLFWSLIYNVIGILVAAGVFYIPFGWQLNPMFGALAMSFSSIFVVLNALRLTGFAREEKGRKHDQ